MGRGKAEIRVPHFDLERFLMLRAGLAVNAVLDRRKSALLHPFLQRGFVIGAFEHFGVSGERGIE